MSGLNGLENRLLALFDSGAVFWLAVVVALGVGAAHAVAPGHGKAITAAYLVGARARYREALRLGVIVAIMHTFSVLVVALTWVGLSGAASMATETLTAWMQVLAGLVVMGVGLGLIYRHLRARGHSHGHGHDYHHSHDDDDAHGHAHAQEVAALTDPWSKRGLIALGLSGGLLPSPSAFLVLVSGLLTGRALNAVLLVLAFGVGMAATLTGVGVVTLRGFSLISGRAGGWSRASVVMAWVPAIAGIAVSAGGCLYLVVALNTLAS